MLRIDYTKDLHPLLSVVILLGIIGTYGLVTVPEVSDPGDYPDYDFMLPAVAKWQPSDIFDGYQHHAKFALAKLSAEVFRNIHAVPFMLSLLLLGATYLLAVQMSGRRIWGLVAASCVAASSIFRQFDTSAVYANDWSLFFVASLYFVKRKWFVSPILFILSILAKPLAVLFMPAMVLMVLFSDIKASHKAALLCAYGALSAGALLAAGGFESYSQVPFNPANFVLGMMEWVYFFMVPDFWLAALMPMLMLLSFVLAAKGSKKALLVLVLMLNTALFGGILEGMTDNLWNEPYRYIPLIVLFGCGIGVVVEEMRHKARQKALAEPNKKIIPTKE